MNVSINSILLRRKSKIEFVASNVKEVLLPSTEGMVGAIIANVAKLGYVLDVNLIDELKKANYSQLVSFHSFIISQINELIGYVNHRPMYPNFPSQVASASDEELYINAIMHYLGDSFGVRIMPSYDVNYRLPFCELSTAKWIGLGTFDDITDCFKSILESKASPSQQDREDMETFIEVGFVPKAVFVNKEVMAAFFGVVEGKSISATQRAKIKNIWDTQVSTATDVLRFVTAISNGDVSLGKNTKFKNIPRPLRKFILSKLESMNQNNVGEDMMRHRQKWIRLGEKLHPREYTSQFPKTAKCFSEIRNGGCVTYNSTIEFNLTLGNMEAVIAQCSNRPGDFARRLNQLISKSKNPQTVIDAFSKVASSVSTPVLWQLYGYFCGRNAICSYKNRIFLPKKSSIAITTENTLTPFSEDITTRVIVAINDALYNAYKEKTEVKGKKVFIDPICANLLIPSGNRSVSTALRQVGRGSRFDLKKSTVRLFMYWKDIKNSRVDLDLSAVTFDADWNFLGHCSWTNLRGSRSSYYHSGDITSAPNGASEFIDINLDNLDKNVRYVVCNVNSFTGQKMNQLEVGFMGWMERSNVNSGEIYEPTSVEGRCDLTADASSSSPLIVDVETKQIVWCDLPTTLTGGGYHVGNTLPITVATAAKATRMAETSASLFDIFATNIIAQDGADVVFERSEADFVIAEDGDLSPFDLTRIMADWV